MEIAVNIIVSGMVQGVGFRYFVYLRATRLGLRGYVKNLYNGDVEIEAEGDRSIIEEFIKDVKVGPRSAHITDVKINWKQPKNISQYFEIR